MASGMPNSPVKLESEQSYAICQEPLGDRPPQAISFDGTKPKVGLKMGLCAWTASWFCFVRNLILSTSLKFG